VRGLLGGILESAENIFFDGIRNQKKNQKQNVLEIVIAG
jgi:hypothetical protein